MFPSARTSTLAQRALDALRLTRSFLTLEDDYDVDWEVDRNEPSQTIHPHRAPLRERRRARRPGEAAAVVSVCLSPVNQARQTPSPPLRGRHGCRAGAGRCAQGDRGSSGSARM
ncbi:MAG TPA: hypothetical protein VGH93_09310 [Solirubrobacteraceae bacterium]